MILITAKGVTIFLILACTAFTVSTIVLAVQKSNLKSDLSAAQKLLDEFEDAVKHTTLASLTTTIRSTQSPLVTTEKVPNERIDYRLPKNVEPELYDLFLHPNLETGEFEGQVIITIKVIEKTYTITLHSAKLDIESVYFIRDVFSASGETVDSYSFDTVRDFLIIKSTRELNAGSTVSLGILFRGHEMHTKIVGLYTSAYKKADGFPKRIFTSKFEPTYARQAFPCWDEPDFKAKYIVSLVYPKDGNYRALSNMDEDNNALVGEYRQVYFKESVPMSSYLVCFLISDFVAETEEIETNGIGGAFNVSVYATPEQKGKVKFALETAKAVTEYYIDYFQVAYPLPKLDMAAIPDFVSGAMEHWGLITYRETALLYDKDYSSTVNKQRVAQVVAHEIAHMWFGNLVTLKWWDDLWLNEGFARFIEYKGQHHAYPDWNMPEQFLVNAIQPVMKFDSTLASHPIVQTVNSPAEITELFDTISYEKGASVIRMLENFIGEDNFRTAVTNYLTKYKFDNTVTDDFLSEIEELRLNIDVKEILRTWTEQRGFPTVSVEQTSPTTYVLSQKVFLANKNDHALINVDDTDFKYRWSIPITYYVNGVEQELKWFYHNQEKLTIEVPENTQWLKINNKQVGYYRVNYDTKMWVNFASLLKENVNVMSTSDRAHILNDVFSLADADEVNYEIAFNMMSYLEAETQYVPWRVAATKLSALKRALMFTEDFKAFKTFAKNAVVKIYKAVGWNVDDNEVLKNRLRMTVLSLACSLGVEDCIKEAKIKFDDFLNNDIKPHPDLREVVYYYGMAHYGNEEAWDKIWSMFVTEQDANEKTKLMDGLSAIQIPWILKRFVDLAWNPANVREQDYFTCIQGIAANPVGEPIVWEYVRENWTRLVDRFTIGNRYLGRMIPAITGNFDSETKLAEVTAFFELQSEAGAGAASREQALANIKVNIQWLKSNLNDIHTWLESNVV